MTDCNLETDILVIGGGLAGCFAAIKSKEADKTARVMVVDKGYIGSSGQSVFAAGLINICTDKDNADLWFEEIVKTGEYLNDQDWVKVMLSDTYPLVKEMERWGDKYNLPVLKTDESGNLIRVKGRGNKHTETSLVYPKNMMKVLRRKLLEEKVTLVERVMITDLLVQDGQVAGALGFDYRNKRVVAIRSKCVIMAAAGCGFKSFYIGHRNLTGEGQAAAYEVGAVFRGMDQPTSNTTARITDIHGMGLIVATGGRFINKHGEEFMYRYDSVLGNRVPLPKLVISFAVEVARGNGPIYLDLSGINQSDRSMLRELVPDAFNSLESLGIRPFEEPIEWMPAFYGSCAQGGGLCIDLDCRTNIPGLLAVGDSSCSPVQGTLSVQGVNLSFCVISGARAGREAAKFISGDVKLLEADSSIFVEQFNKYGQKVIAPLRRLDGPTPDEVIYKIQETVIPYEYRYITNEEKLQIALDKIEDIRENYLPLMQAKDAHELVKVFEARSMLTVAEMITRSVMARKESRGFVYRDDYPNTDNINWIKWVRVRKENGKMVTVLQDVPLRYRRPEREIKPRMEGLS